MRLRNREPDFSEEAGFTLIETMMALAILSIAIVTLLAGLATAVQASDRHRKQAAGEVLLRQAVEELKARPYSECDSSTITGAAPYGAFTMAVPTGFNLPVITSVEIARPGDPFNFNPLWTAASTYTLPAGSPKCGTDYDDTLVQRITVSVSTIDGRATETTVFVKRGIS